MDKTILLEQPPFARSFHDSFTRADGATAAPWSVKAGTWAISSNKLTASVLGNIGIPFSRNAVISANTFVIASGSATAGLIARYTNEANYVRFFFLNADKPYIAKVIAGVATNTAFAGISYVDGAPIRLIVKNNLYTCFYNNVMIGQVTYTDAILKTGRIFGLRIGAVAGSSFSNFTISKLEG